MPDLARNKPRQIAGAFDPAPKSVPVERESLLDQAKKDFSARRLRQRIFGKAMFGETGWDLLLGLYICGQQTGGTSVVTLTRFCEAPQTTVMRWLDYLESRGWVDRDREQTNRKIANVEVTDEAREALEAYLAETLRQD